MQKKPTGVMLSLSRAKLSNPGVTLLEGQDLLPMCPRCHATQAWNRTKCTNCGEQKPPILACNACSEPLVNFEVEYTATSENQSQVTARFPAYRCPKCSHIFLLKRYPDNLDAFIATTPTRYRVIPEVGISSDDSLEVFVCQNPHSGAILCETPKTPPIHKQANGMTMRFGTHSELFEQSLSYITNYEEEQHDEIVSPTLYIEPGPPYSIDQRRTLHMLLSLMRLELGTPISFRSVHFGKVSDKEKEHTFRQLLSLVLQWPFDTDKRALALANAICNDEHPGFFVNAFRLLDIVLNRLIDDDIQRARWDKEISDQYFLVAAKIYDSDFASKLKWRLDLLPNMPKSLLRDIWRVVQPSKGFNPDEVFTEIALASDVNRHGKCLLNDEIILPWEKPAFDFFANRLLKLIIMILQEHVEQREPGSKSSPPPS